MSLAIVGPVISALILALALWLGRQLRRSIEEMANPGSATLQQRVDEACDLSARAVVAATRAEASAKRTEQKVDDLALALRVES